jgi:hypothetical protein
MESLSKLIKDLLFGSMVVIEDNTIVVNYKQMYVTINWNTLSISIIKEDYFELINIIVRIPSNYIDIVKLRKVIDITGEKWVKE